MLPTTLDVLLTGLDVLPTMLDMLPTALDVLPTVVDVFPTLIPGQVTRGAMCRESCPAGVCLHPDSRSSRLGRCCSPPRTVDTCPCAAEQCPVR